MRILQKMSTNALLAKQCMWSSKSNISACSRRWPRLCNMPRVRNLRRTSSTSTSASTSSSCTIRPTITTFSEADLQEEDRLLVIGSGVAGSAAALIAAETYKIPVTLIYAGNVATDCNSYWAQGGIIYRNYNPKFGDSIASLVHDIHRAGAGLCNDAAVVKVATEGPDRVRQLLLNNDNGSSGGGGGVNGEGNNNNNNNSGTGNKVGPFAHVPFDKCRHNPNTLSLCLEASHSSPRILHKADHTGRVITQEITRAVARHALITQVPHTIVTDLIVSDGDVSSGDISDSNAGRHVVGVQTLDRTTGMRSSAYGTYGTVLASGGLAGIYQHSTNPAGFNALGSSIALAVRQGVQVRDLEFVQFHPTALNIPNDTTRFLLTEALRGEGAILRNAQGRAFAKDYHVDGELAPRDIVARAVFEESKKTAGSGDNGQQQQCVYLDITHRDPTWLHERFPTIQQHLQAHNLDLAKDWLPITPAAHYTCGGIATDLNGCTSIPGLYAAGEAACTGLHGGNRLASTSLLEGLVFGASVADYVASTKGLQVRHEAMERLYGDNTSDSGAGGTRINVQKQAATVNGSVNSSSSNSTASQRRRASLMTPFHIEHAAHRSMQLLKSLRKTMWDSVGVVRTPNGLLRALEELRPIQQEMDALHATWPTLETAAVRDAAHAGLAVAQAAWANRTSVGAHCIVPDDNAVVDPSTIDLGVIAAADSDSDDDDEESARSVGGGGGGGASSKNGIDSDSDEEEQAVAAAR